MVVVVVVVVTVLRSIEGVFQPLKSARAPFSKRLHRHTIRKRNGNTAAAEGL